MRFFCLFLLVWNLQSALNSQNLNHAGHCSVDNTGPIVSINSKSYYQRSCKSSCCSQVVGLVAVDSNGVELWMSKLGVSYDFLGRTIVTLDKCLFTSCYSWKSCDQVGAKDVLTKVDTLGNIKFQVILQSVFGGQSKVKGILQNPDSTYSVFTNSTVIKLSKTGGTLTETSILTTSVSAVSIYTAGSVIVNMNQNSAQQNMILSPSGTVSAQLNCPEVLTKTQALSSGFIGRSVTGKLQVFNAGLSMVVNSGTLFPSTYYFQDFDIRNDTIHAVMSVNGNPRYIRMDALLNQIYLSTAVSCAVNASGITLNAKNRLQVITNTGPGSASHTGLFTFPQNGYFYTPYDIGVSSFTLNNASYTGGGSSAYYGTADAAVTVRNYGTVTVNQFYLNHYATAFLCVLHHHPHYTVNIAPGDSIVVQTGTFYLQPMSSQAPLVGGTFKTSNITLFTSVPNFHNDGNGSNDAKTDSVEILITGLSEIVNDDSSVSVFPNPSNGSFSTKGDFKHKITLVSVLGTEVYRTNEYAIEHAIDIKIPQGVYLLQIQSDKGFSVRKIVVDE